MKRWSILLVPALVAGLVMADAPRRRVQGMPAPIERVLLDYSAIRGHLGLLDRQQAGLEARLRAADPGPEHEKIARRLNGVKQGISRLLVIQGKLRIRLKKDGVSATVYDPAPARRPGKAR